MMPPSELISLWEGCRRSPADDTPRLVLADWLEEHGEDARAALIRVQVELAHPSSNEARIWELKMEQSALTGRYSPEWLGDLQTSLARTISHSASFHRGLIHFRVTAEQAGNPQLIEWMNSDLAIWVEQVVIQFDSLAALEQCKSLHHYTGRLAVVVTVGDQVLSWDNRGRPSFAAIENLTSQRWKQFVDSDAFARIHSLQISGINCLGLTKELTESHSRNLHSLQLDCRTHEEEAIEVLSCLQFPRLTALNVGGWSTASLLRLTRTQSFPSLQCLNLLGNPIGDAGLIALCESRLAKQLCQITLQNTQIGDAGLEALVASPLLNRLPGPSLNLMMNRIGDAGLTALARSPDLARFQELVLRENQVGDTGIEALANSPYARSLTYIDFWRNRIRDEGAIALSQSTHLDQVIDLCLKENQITDTGIAAMMEKFGNRVKV